MSLTSQITTDKYGQRWVEVFSDNERRLEKLNQRLCKNETFNWSIIQPSYWLDGYVLTASLN